MDVKLTDENIQQKVNMRAEAFIRSVSPIATYSAYAIYFRPLHQGDSECIRTFFGIDLKKIDNHNRNHTSYKVPNMLSAKFQYTGDLLHIGTLVVRDLARWLTIAKIEMEKKSEILFIQAYDKAYKKNNGSSSIYLPIRVIPQGV